MKNEFYEYIFPSNRVKKEGNETTKDKTTKKDDLIGYCATFFVLLVFSLPMAISQTFIWSLTLLGYIVLLIMSKFDRDPYSKTLVFFGGTALYLCVVLSYLIITESFKRFQTSFIPSLLILAIICTITYEIILFINILLKRYSAKLKHKNKHPAIYTAVGTFCGGIIGSVIARKISPHLANSHLSVWLVLIACSLLFSISISFLQKYVLYKVLYKDMCKSRSSV